MINDYAPFPSRMGNTHHTAFTFPRPAFFTAGIPGIDTCFVQENQLLLLKMAADIEDVIRSFQIILFCGDFCNLCMKLYLL
jgi:hypothetical protein